jgi:hypothetical protein
MCRVSLRVLSNAGPESNTPAREIVHGGTFMATKKKAKKKKKH